MTGAPQENVVEGALLPGKFRLERVLGRGGMGVVVAAHHLELDQLVAIKFLLPEALRSAEAVARFEREARAAVKIQSEHVARVTDVSRLDNGAPYMVMELLRGSDLEMLLRERGPLPLAEVADYLLQAGEAIAEAHGLGIVHRDLKPSNLFLTQRADGSACIKVLDFGISKLIAQGPDAQGMTSTTAVIGSPLYMSPEQLMSARDVDMRTDIWSLGVICFELLAGKPPFVAESLPQLCMTISLAAPTPLRNYRPDLAPEVEAMLLRCLAKAPGNRFATVAELATELIKFAPPHAQLSAERIERLARVSGFPANAPAPPAPSLTTAASSEMLAGTQTLAEFGHTRASTSTTKVRFGLGLAVLLASACVLALALSRRAPRRSESTPASAALSASPLPAGSISALRPTTSAAPDAPPPDEPIQSSAAPLSDHQVPPIASATKARPLTRTTTPAAKKSSASPNPSAKTSSFGGRL